MARPHEYTSRAEDGQAGANEIYARAVELERAGNHQAALPLLWKAAGLAPQDADIQNALGEGLQRMGALDAAIDAYRRALAARPAHRKAANNLIVTLVTAGRSPEAVTRARELVASAPGDADAYFTLGLAQSEQDMTEAMKTFRRVLELSPRHVLARYNLALVLKREDRMIEAIDELKRTIAIEPRAEAYYTLGVIHWHQGDLRLARDALLSAVTVQPHYPDALHALGSGQRAEGDLAGAAASLRRAVAIRPDLWAAHYTLGQVLQRSGDQGGAAKHLAEAERLRRDAQLVQEAGVWTTTGTQRLDAGNPTEALDHFRRAIEVFEPYAPAHYQMGRALQRIGQRDAASVAFRRAQQLNPSLVPPPDQQPK